MDDIPKDPLTGGDGHLDGIKAYLYDKYFSIRLSTFKIDSLGAVAVAAPSFKDPAQPNQTYNFAHIHVSALQVQKLYYVD